MKEREILKIFQDTGALLQGHFLLTSGLHSDQYFQCAKVLRHPDLAERLCLQIGRHFEQQKPQVVIAPAVGGIIVAHEVARAIKTPGLFAERLDGQMRLRRGFELQEGERVLAVEDVITTGGSVGEVLELVIARGAIPVGVGCIVDRSVGQVDFGFELFSLVKLKVEVKQPEECRLCQKGLPLIKPGSREVK
ncbi:orotate phosphoribosyltransferase [bacterium]|nr:orotate phosphoribosyltransferase [bacterium]